MVLQWPKRWQVRREAAGKTISTVANHRDKAVIIWEAGFSEANQFPRLIGVIPDLNIAWLITLEPHLMLSGDEGNGTIEVLLKKRFPCPKINLRRADRGTTGNFRAYNVIYISRCVS
jgi:hypothetical protein